MRIIEDYPPLIDEIDERFHIRGKPVIFAWGDTIYNPQKNPVADWLIAHEAEHGQRQGSDLTDIVSWWRRYMDEDAFRMEEEAYAHLAEYTFQLGGTINRQQRRSLMMTTAKRFANPIYDYGLTKDRAKSILTGMAV